VVLAAAATAAIYTLSLHDALPICPARSSPPRAAAPGAPAAPRGDRIRCRPGGGRRGGPPRSARRRAARAPPPRRRRRSPRSPRRSEEHTSELQSRENLVCRLLLEK